MKIHVNVQKFSEVLSLATRALTGKTAMPILSTVLIEAANNRVRITGTNLDLSVSASFETNVKMEGGVCILGKRLQSIMGQLAGEEAEISVDAKHSTTLACAPSRFKLLGLGPDEFPKRAAEVEGGEALVFQQADLAGILASVVDAQSADESRYTLHGAHVASDKDSLVFVATDGRRMHINTQASQGAKGASTIIPSKSLQVLHSLLGSDGTVSLRWDDKRLVAVIGREGGDITLVTKLVEGNYPNWKQIIPKYTGVGIELDREELIAALKRASLALSEKSSSVRMNIEGTAFTVTASGADIGDATEVLLCTNADDLAGTISANVAYMIQALQGMAEEKVLLRLDKKSPEVGPIFLTSKSIQVIVMPTRQS